ncbi:hypothetical protein P4679_24775 [Priestia megaterium]|uniref:hypothetical protein n=1 Tax=Priestia megaterium TaxID=1404 RepID=UPI002E1B0DA4|nr:hypothetical protein [Priestia megaterium]
MKNVSKIAAGAAALALALSLIGCASKEPVSQTTEQEEAQKKIKIELTFLQNECNRLINKEEDTEKTFQSYKNDFNLLSTSVDSTSKIAEMSDDNLQESINLLEKDVDKLNGKESLKAYKKYTSPNTIYQVTMMKNMHSILEATNGREDGKDLGVTFFYNHIHSSQKDINKDIKPTLNYIKNGPIYKLSLVQDELQKHRDNFSSKQLEQLETATQAFKSSLNAQLIKVSSYKNTIKNPYTRSSYSDEENEKNIEARTYLADFESDLGIVNPDIY